MLVNGRENSNTKECYENLEKTKDNMFGKSIDAMLKELEDIQHKRMLYLMDNYLWMQEKSLQTRFNITH